MGIYPGSGCFFLHFYCRFFFHLDSLGTWFPIWLELVFVFCLMVGASSMLISWWFDSRKTPSGNLTQTYVKNQPFLDAVPINKTTWMFSYFQQWSKPRLFSLSIRDEILPSYIGITKKALLFEPPSTNRVIWLWKKSCNQHHWGYFHPQKKLIWQWNIHHLKMYFLLNICIFPCHVSFHGRKPSYHPLR